MKSILAIILILFLGACGKTPQGAVKHYHLTGKVVSLNAADQTVTVAAAAIPNFMDAMTMEYPVKSKTDFQVLRVGASIEGTVNVADAGGYDLSEIKSSSSGS